MPESDVVILGGGSGGYACALRASQLGLSVVLIEKGKLGGTCLHNGCIPTKALLHAGEVADSARESAAFGVDATLNGIDMTKVNAYRDGIVGRLYKGLQGLVKSRNVTYVEGTGRLVAPNTVEVNGERYVGRNVVLATGSYARTLPGLEIGGRIMTSDQALDLDWIPERVLVLGGGVIGVEFASVWKSFGSDVTIIEALPRLVPAEDEAVSKAFERAYRKRGINFSTGVRFASATQDSAGVTVTLEDGQVLTADLLLVAVGQHGVDRDDQVGLLTAAIGSDVGAHPSCTGVVHPGGGHFNHAWKVHAHHTLHGGHAIEQCPLDAHVRPASGDQHRAGSPALGNLNAP